MRIGIFGGSFDPVHREHVAFVEAAQKALKLDKVIIVPSFVAPHKRDGAKVSGKNRLEMCKIAFQAPYMEVSDYELCAEGTSFTYLTCRYFAEKYPDTSLFFLVGADMLENFFEWKHPEDILSHVTLAACGRGQEGVAGLRARFHTRFGCDFWEVSFTGEAVSSTDIRVALAFRGVITPTELSQIDGGVLSYIQSTGLYEYPECARALALEKEPRIWHSYRVARLACRRARSLDIPEKQVLVASMLHDCAKYVPLDSPHLKGFVAPENVPPPVMHQYAGAYLAEHEFSVDDEDILSAIRYHTSGRENMSTLGKLIYLADLLEEDRAFEGVEELRRLFWQDVDACFFMALEQQIYYLRSTGKPVYPLTEQALAWERAKKCID